MSTGNNLPKMYCVINGPALTETNVKCPYDFLKKSSKSQCKKVRMFRIRAEKLWEMCLISSDWNKNFIQKYFAVMLNFS